MQLPLVMGIVNVSPDSFFDGNPFQSADSILAQVAQMVADGAQIIDVGAVSTRPGALPVSQAEEAARLLPALELICKAYPDLIVSVDTTNAATAQQAIAAGAAIVNDISGGLADPAMFATVAVLGVPYILMHMQGSPQTMQQNPDYTDVVAEVLYFFTERINALKLAGVTDIIIDPGFGFGKTVEHNYQLLAALAEFRMLGYPVLAGVSRKSMINKVLGTKPETALNGTTVVNTMALMNGASILRVHDVKEAVEAVKLYNALSNAASQHQPISNGQ